MKTEDLVHLIRAYGDACALQGMALVKNPRDVHVAKSMARSEAFEKILDALYPHRTTPPTEGSVEG